jgi:hypothetical protein
VKIVEEEIGTGLQRSDIETNLAAMGTTFSALKLWLSNHFFRMTFLSCCNGELRSTPLRSISSPPFSLSLLFVMTVSFSAGAGF